jgi:hypothetical protein
MGAWREAAREYIRVKIPEGWTLDLGSGDLLLKNPSFGVIRLLPSVALWVDEETGPSVFFKSKTMSGERLLDRVLQDIAKK